MWLLNHYTRDTSYGFSFESYGWMMLQQELPRDYVIATGVQYSVRQFIEKAAGAAWDHHSLGRGGECDCPG